MHIMNAPQPSDMASPPRPPAAVLPTRGAASPPTATDHGRTADADDGSDPKRRKIRKGTRSCWECKRRKIRCVFADGADAVCVGCARRGTSCVGQEFPEEMSSSVGLVGGMDGGVGGRGNRPMGDRIVRVEALIEQLVRKVGTGDLPASNGSAGANGGANPGMPTPRSVHSESGPSTTARTLYGPSPDGLALEPENPNGSDTPPTAQVPAQGTALGAGRYARLSQALYEALPSQEDIDAICDAGGHIAVHFHVMMTRGYSQLADDTEAVASCESLRQRPQAHHHPVLIAKYMLLLATFLQYLHPEVHAHMANMSEPTRTIMKRLADAAISLVTTNDELLGTLEGLEAVHLEGTFQANSGNLRRGWMAFRRAIVVAQLMGLHRRSTLQPLKVLDPANKANGNFLWFRTVMAERHLCLMLGLPQSSRDVSMASETALAQEASPMGRLERVHTKIASRILDRNESCCEGPPNTDDFYTETMAIDLALQDAAKMMPNRWWLVPQLSEHEIDSKQLFMSTLHLVDQLFHFNLLNQLHLAYMLCSSATSERTKYDYSRMTCVNASRDVLVRWVVFRSINRVAYCCRVVDFFALMAGMTLILAHLDGHSLRARVGAGAGGVNFLAHQRLGDRGMVEQVLENMELVGHLNEDAFSERSATLLRRLLALEACACNGPSVAASREDEHAAEHAGEHISSMRLCIPYFGVISIARDGHIALEAQADSASQQQPVQLVAPGDPLPSLHECPEDALPSSSVSTTPASPKQGGIWEFAQGPGVQSEGGCTGLLTPLHTDPDYGPLPGLPSVLPSATATSPAQQTSAGITPDDVAGGTGGGLPGQGQFAPQFPAAVSDALAEQYPYPGLTATSDDWAFQGVDMVFFDRLMRGAEFDLGNAAAAAGGPGNGADWATGLYAQDGAGTGLGGSG